MSAMTTSLNRVAAQAVRGALRDRGISQAVAGAALGLSQSAMSRRLSAAVPLNLDDVSHLASLLGVPSLALLGDDAEPVVSPPLLANAVAERARREQVPA